MAQQLNLLETATRAPADWLRAGPVLVAVTAIVAAAAAGSAALERHAAQLAAAVPPPATPVAAAIAVPPAGAVEALDAELRRLHTLERHQQQLRAALATGAAGAPDGYTPYLKALARQAQPSLWITGFAISGVGDAIEIEGRMIDASVLPGYLRRLNGESRFGGRAFAQLQLRAMDDAGGETPWTEFSLRSPAPGAAP